ncbi:hypothetical protein FB567DRAFT_618902 [Paraphoma chrysanthemicola]|uniref:C2H2-type domain-containing protein n=1 Tax=Paraphoma chrysanthemicola TaxID=798071 RepID=A0A8K0W0T1_9PLEO|nr:hypothetical protein FB567DRAFT_618902 [Paraphoma chrysanthemicola]
MTNMAFAQFRQQSLPKLSMSKDIARRDSLSSSRTRDSGYNSDLDVSFSPLDYLDTDQGMLHQQEQDEEIEKWIKDNLPSHSRPKQRVSSITSISSASSCDMYTATDPSEDEHDAHNIPASSRLTRSVIKTIEVIMRKVEVNLRYSAFIQCNGGNGSASASYNSSLSHQGGRRVFQGVGKRKSRADDNPPPNEDDDEGPNKRRRGSLATVESSDSGLRFACPFYKHEPNRYRNRRTCPGPGWPTVHRMKEHLYRAHAQSIYCPRCYTMFDTDTDLSNHLRSAHCQVSAPQPIEGIDRETLKALRKRSPALRLEEDKWRDVYHLLFPDVGVEDTPSPFYDGDAPSEDSRRFRRELLRRVQQELINTAGQLPGAVEQQLLHQVAHIIRRCEDDLLSSFDASTLSVPSLSDRRTSTSSTTSTMSTPPNPRPGRRPPSPLAATTEEPDTIPPSAPIYSNLPSATHDGSWHVAPGQRQREPEPAVNFRSVPWDHAPAPTPSSEWIDWDAIFPPGPDTVCNEALAGFSVPMWTQ